jgi:hypothetical protein
MMLSVIACLSEKAELQCFATTWLVIAMYDLSKYCNVGVIQR